jgi:hypothetical protein
MPAASYLIHNASHASTAAPVKQPVNSSGIQTMMQLAPLAQGYSIRIIEWGCSFDASAAATPFQVEMFACTGAATMSTAYAAADVQPYGSWLDIPANTAGSSGAPLSLGTALSGFATTTVTEGTVANYRGFDLQLIAPTNQYVKQYPLGREPQLGGNSATQEFLRVRITAASAANAYVYVIFEV